MRTAVLCLLAFGLLSDHSLSGSSGATVDGPELALREVAAADASSAEALFAAAEAAIWDLSTGHLIYAGPPAAEHGLPEEARRQALASPATSLGVIRAADLRSFVAARYPEILRGRYLLKLPISIVRPLGPGSGVGETLVTATSLNETFETDPFSAPEGQVPRWTRELLDADGGGVDWGFSACFPHGGGHAIDAIRGGPGGSPTPCEITYPPDQTNLCVYGQTLDLRGSQAWLQAWVDLATDAATNDRLAFLFRDPSQGGVWLGYTLSGNTGGWFKAVFNLKTWPGDLDLSKSSAASFGIYFESDSSGAQGFGARVDDLKTLKGDTLPALTCSAAATPAAGTIPLDTMLVGTVTGATAAATYTWITGEGPVLTGGKNAVYEYETSGEHDAWFIVRDTIAGVPTECRATVHLRCYAPGNDACSRATNVAQTPYTTTFSTAGYSRDAGELACSQSGATAWYRYTATSNGQIDASLCGSGFDTTLGIYTGACGALTPVGCDDDGCTGEKPSASLLTGIPVTAGTTYWIQAGGFGGARGETGEAQLALAFTPCSEADTVAPAVSAPAAGTVVQTTCEGPQGGATPDSSPELAAFLAGGSAADVCDGSPQRITPQVGGEDVVGTTAFPAGQLTSVTFRFQDAGGNIGSAVAQVRVVRRGDVNLDVGSKVDVSDLIAMASLIVGNAHAGFPPYLAPLQAGDTDGDGDVDIFDLVRAAHFIVGNIPCLGSGLKDKV